jgi:hypothetical protein
MFQASGNAHMRLHESNVIFVKFDTGLQRTVFVLVFVPYPL